MAQKKVAARKALLSVSALALLALTACAGQKEQAQSAPSATAVTSATASASPSATPSPTPTPTPTPEPTTETPTPEPTTETPTPEPTPEPTTETPSPEPTPEPTPEPSIDPYSMGQTVTENGVTFFLPDGYNPDSSIAQPDVFARQYTHLRTQDDAAGRLMVGTPFTNTSGKSVEELDKALVESLTSAWNIKEVVETRSYYRADGSQVIRTEVRFSSTSNPGYIFTINNGVELMYAGLLVNEGDAIFVQRIEESLAIVPR